MESRILPIGLKFASSIGAGLSDSELATVEGALCELRCQSRRDKAFFWGRISCASDKVYWIAYTLGLGFDMDTFPQKRFFYMASGDNSFRSLGQSDSKTIKRNQAVQSGLQGALKNRKFPELSGSPENVLGYIRDGVFTSDTGVTDSTSENAEGSTNRLVSPRAPVEVSELDVLAFLVKAIDTDCAVVPRTSYIVDDELQLTENVSFRGLDYFPSRELSSYVYLRSPKDLKTALSDISSGRDALQFNLFDSVDSPESKKQWVVRSSAVSGDVTLRSLLWPGYVAFNVPKTNFFGGAYFGDGKYNHQLSLMV